ncbi:MAG: hypothetical protein KDJ36_00085 [Hyphomicrobiaceae bacterium]|nr:hypothetical protein [Hyphomicrobiaceae bacterium]
MTYALNSIRQHRTPRLYNVSLDTLDACQMQIKARSPHEARRIAGRSWAEGDDITAFLAETDLWTVEEIMPFVA